MIFAPLVSVIVPVFNTCQYLDKCIESILQQTYSELEIILVDDGSSDGSSQICDRYSCLDKRVRVLHQNNCGVSMARENGISVMNGDYGMFVDSDDWIEHDTIEKCVEAVKEYGAECVLFSYSREYTNNAIPVSIYQRSCYFVGDDAKKIYRHVWGLYAEELQFPQKGDSLSTCCMKMYSVDLLKESKSFDIRKVGCSEDTLFNIYALRHCKSFYYINEPLYHYRKHQESISSSYRPNLIEQYKTLYQMFDEAKEQLKIDEQCTQAYYNRTALSIIGIGLNESENPVRCERIKRIRQYINSTRYQDGYRKLQFHYLPFVWKCFFFCSGHSMAGLVYLTISVMKVLKNRI